MQIIAGGTCSAFPSIPETQSVQAALPVIMHIMDDRDALPDSLFINAGRHGGEDIMDNPRVIPLGRLLQQMFIHGPVKQHILHP
ncbi:hypothetical protein [Akkermansia sp.]|uniref:hypothetical protein n=1 Tax=Akkermansia sp. TaxID=1872421 RepID=UPI0025C1D835|nr:hypothetical protein [Akkermansia sp.]